MAATVYETEGQPQRWGGSSGDKTLCQKLDIACQTKWF